jgi:hypothetical protein
VKPKPLTPPAGKCLHCIGPEDAIVAAVVIVNVIVFVINKNTTTPTSFLLARIVLFLLRKT